MNDRGQDRVLELFLSFWVSRGLMAAVEMDLFEQLEGEGLTLDEVRGRLGLADRPARALLDLARATGLVACDGDRYRNTADASRYLYSGSEHSVRNYVRDERATLAAWGELEEALRQNAPPLPQDPTGYRDIIADYFLDFLHGHTLAMAERLAEVVDLSGVGRIMDIGGGSGAASIALCRANPGLHAVVVDLPPVAARAAEHAARVGLTDRIDTYAADIFSDPLPEGCDAAMICNFLHDFSEPKARRILARAAEALPSGARLVVMEMAPNDDRSSPPIPVAFALTMIVNTEGGDAYTVPQYRSWLEDAGFTVERVAPLGGRIVTTAIEARKTVRVQSDD